MDVFLASAKNYIDSFELYIEDEKCQRAYGWLVLNYENTKLWTDGREIRR